MLLFLMEPHTLHPALLHRLAGSGLVWRGENLLLFPLPREGQNKPVRESKGVQLQGKWICAGLLVNSLMCLLR